MAPLLHRAAIMRTQTSIKNQLAVAIVLAKVYFYDYITWFSEPCTVCNCNCDCYVMYVRHSIA